MISIKEIADMTFRVHPSIKISDHSGDLQVFNLLMSIDGKRSVEMIAREDAYEMEFLTAKINQLLDMQLIEAFGVAGAALPKELIDDLASELSGFVGPMAGVLINECAAKMGHAPSNIPSAKVQTFLDALAGFIQPRSKAEEFKDRMSARISTMG